MTTEESLFFFRNFEKKSFHEIEDWIYSIDIKKHQKIIKGLYRISKKKAPKYGNEIDFQKLSKNSDLLKLCFRDDENLQIREFIQSVREESKRLRICPFTIKIHP